MISLASTPTLARAISAFNGQIGHERFAAPQAEVDFETLAIFQKAFEMEGPYHLAKKLGVLKNGSGEDLAVEFMGLWNREVAVIY